MIARHQEKIEALFAKTERIDVGRFSRSKAALDSFFQQLAAEYRAVKNHILLDFENMKMAVDIRNCLAGQAKPPERDILHDVADRYYYTRSMTLYQLHCVGIQIHLKKGRSLLRQNRVPEAYDTWIDALRQAPDNREIKSQLLQIPQAAREGCRLENPRETYRFKHLKSFGYHRLAKPAFLLASESDHCLRVADAAKKKIFKFDFSGEYIGAASPYCGRTGGMFAGDNADIWLCDFDAHQLVRMNSDDTIVETINLANLIPGPAGASHPMFGCLKDNRFYLMVSDVNQNNRRLVCFHKENGGVARIGLPEAIQTPIDLVLYKNEVYVADKSSGVIYRYIDHKRKFYPLTRRDTPGKIFRFTILNNNIFMSGMDDIMKMSLGGQRHFTVSIGLITKGLPASVFGLAGHREDNCNYLFAGDFTGHCIHEFLI